MKYDRLTSTMTSVDVENDTVEVADLKNRCSNCQKIIGGEGGLKIFYCKVKEQKWLKCES